jgi:hypothetical protein
MLFKLCSFVVFTCDGDENTEREREREREQRLELYPEFHYIYLLIYLHVCTYLSLYLWRYSTLDFGRAFSFLIFLDGGSARRKASTYTKNNTNTE